MDAGEGFQLRPSTAILSGAVVSSAQEQQVLIGPEGEASIGLIHIHSVHNWSALQSQDIGTVLIELEKISAVLIQNGKVGSYDDLFRPDEASVCQYRFAVEGPGRCLLIDGKIRHKGGEESQRMKLSLVPDLYGSGGGKGERGEDRFPGKTKLLQGPQLVLQLLGLVHRVDIGILGFKITGNSFAKVSVALQGRQICLQIHSSFFSSEAAQKSMSKESVLNGHFGGSPSGDALSHPV